MVDKLRLDIESPLAGWAMVRLTAPGVRLEFDASYTPWDSIGELAQAIAGLLAGLPEQVVAWNTEPVEYEFRFTTQGVQARLEVYQYPDTRRRRRTEAPVAVVEGDTISIARAIWRGLRRLQGAVSAEAFAAAWEHPFPASTVERIGEQFRG
ncbi:MAG TPA: hypothetical protein VMF69_18445 [Gemmataceae bacterium]|nr:hypothetical protein [Gemmataceae bacterium]